MTEASPVVSKDRTNAKSARTRDLQRTNDALTDLIESARRPEEAVPSGRLPHCQEAVDLKEVVFLVDSASGLFALAMESHVDLGALFEAIIAATPGDCLVKRLASMGERLCDERANDFDCYREDYNLHTEQYMAALQERSREPSSRVSE
jgi:hypothetical protein